MQANLLQLKDSIVMVEFQYLPTNPCLTVAKKFHGRSHGFEERIPHEATKKGAGMEFLIQGADGFGG